MKLTYEDMNIFGVYVTPFVPMMMLAAAIALPLLRLADRLGVTRYVWHSSLFNVAIYIIVLALVVIGMGDGNRDGW
jgi:hypothetical protein